MNMQTLSEAIAKVSRTAADLAKSTGLTRIGPVRRAGVAIMEQVVPPDEIKVTVVGDIDMFVTPRQDGRWYYFADKTGPSDPSGDWTSLIQEGDTVFDIGAHIGYMSLLARHHVGQNGQVVGFEPFPDNFEKLKRNIKLNDFQNVRVEQLAISNDSESLQLYQGDKTIRATAVKEMSEESMFVTVESTTIDEYVDEHGIKPDVVKINVEGAEYDVLDGMLSTIGKFQPDITVEIHPSHLDHQGLSASQTVELLIEQGYSLFTDPRSDLISEIEARKIATEASKPFTVIAKPMNSSM